MSKQSCDNCRDLLTNTFIDGWKFTELRKGSEETMDKSRLHEWIYFNLKVGAPLKIHVLPYYMLGKDYAYGGINYILRPFKEYLR